MYIIQLSFDLYTFAMKLYIYTYIHIHKYILCQIEPGVSKGSFCM